ncbi:MAG: hypothetical protein ACLSHA_11195 [Neglectibacter timonensis]
MKRAKSAPAAAAEDVRIQEFLDMIAPSVINFETDHFICEHVPLRWAQGISDRHR